MEKELMITQTPGMVSDNFEEIEEMLSDKLKIYEGAVFTEESKTIAKKEVAYLRKLKTSVSDRLKEYKQQCLVPYEEAKKKGDKLIVLIDRPVNLINDQVAAFEEKRLEERRTLINSIFLEEKKTASSELVLQMIYDKKWENATTAISNIRKEMTEKIESINRSVSMLKGMDSAAADRAVIMFWQSLDFGKSMAYISQYEQQRKEIEKAEAERRKAEEERKAEAERERIRQEERKRIQEEMRIREEAQREAIMAEPAVVEPETPEEAFMNATDEDDTLPFAQPSTITAFYKIVATPEEIDQVEMAFNSIGIYFERKE